MNQNAIIAIIVLVLVIGGYALGNHNGYIQGESDKQAQWDIEEKAEQVAKDEAIENDRKAKYENELQHQRDITAAKTEAGRAAIAKYLSGIGLLPPRTALHGQQSSDNNQANSASGVNAATSEQGTGSSIEGFAERCASDALKVMRWQEWAQHEDLPVK